MEANRIWHDPVVEIYSNFITPGVCCSANRRWYQLNVGDPVVPDDDDWHHDTRLHEAPDDDWLSSMVEKNITPHYQSTATLPPWNTINTNLAGSPVTFEVLEEGLVPRPVSERFSYGDKPSDKLPTTRFKQLCEKTYLGRGADRCLWQGRNCVFNRIEFDCDVGSDPERSSEDPNDVMKSRFNIVPILAVVLHDEASSWIASNRTEEGAEKESYQNAGFLMHYAGRSLNLVGTPAAGSDSLGSLASTIPGVDSSSTTRDLTISEEQLMDLVCRVQRLSKCGIIHGDICHWNVVLTQPNSAALQTPRLLLIDMGDMAPDYEGDADALGSLLLWCLERSAELKDITATRKRIVIAAAILKGGNYRQAIEVLLPNKMKDRLKRPPSPVNQEVKKRRL